jgi:hypothetical protein
MARTIPASGVHITWGQPRPPNISGCSSVTCSLALICLFTQLELAIIHNGIQNHAQRRAAGYASTAPFRTPSSRGQLPHLRKANNKPGKPIKKLPKTITVTLSSNGEELHNAIAEASGASVHRLRITKGSDRGVIPNDKGTTMDDTGLRESSVIHVKDLGTASQIPSPYEGGPACPSKANIQSLHQAPRSHGAPSSSSNTSAPS